nr:hypothetical protein [Thaumasiovibrio subtropicus]
MTQSLYIKLAVLFIRLDIYREEREWRAAHRRVKIDYPHLNAHLLRDIGADPDGRIAYNAPPKQRATKTVRHLRRYLSSRRIT